MMEPSARLTTTNIRQGQRGGVRAAPARAFRILVHSLDGHVPAERAVYRLTRLGEAAIQHWAGEAPLLWGGGGDADRQQGQSHFRPSACVKALIYVHGLTAKSLRPEDRKPELGAERR